MRAAFKRPMLATLTKKYFSDPQWIFEEKFDGIRCIVVKEGERVTLYSRNRNKLNHRYPELVKAFQKFKGKPFVIDGEIVAFEGKVTSFSKLQQGGKVSFYAFDILHFNGETLTKLPLLERKKILKKSFTFNRTIRYTSHRKTHGERYHKEACKKNWEGIMAKRADSPYVSKRSTDWLKFKCEKGDTFVIGGFTQPQGSRIGFGALLIGYPGKGKLRYAGKVGTGYDDALLQKLGNRLKKLARQTSPFKDPKVPSRGVTWVQPRLKAKIGFTERTNDGKLRHPRFIKLL